MLVTSHAILKNGFQETLASSYHTCPYFQKLLNRHFEFRHSFTEIVDICLLLYYLYVSMCMYNTPPNVCLKFEGLYICLIWKHNAFDQRTHDKEKEIFLGNQNKGFFGGLS